MFKSLFCMVDFLISDVIPYRLKHGFRNGNRKIFILPGKFLRGQLIFINPERRFPFDQLNNFFYILIRT